jgi:hypothetical protein
LLRNPEVCPGRLRRFRAWARTSWSATETRRCCCRRACASGCPRGHLAWFVIDAVERLDLTAFYAAYRLDEQGRAAHEPSMMVALLLYSYALGERSSRRSPTSCSPS